MRKPSLCKLRTSLPNSDHKRRSSPTSATMGPKARSFGRYWLRSSTRALREHLMEDPEGRNTGELWTDGMEEMLVDILYKETLEGKLVVSKITNQDHVRFAEKMTQVGRKSVDPNQIREKITQLRQRLRMFIDLLSQIGMGWNQQTKTIVATEEHWARAISVHGQWKKFKTHGCPDYDLLRTIFGQFVATEVLHYASTQESPSSDEEDHLEEEARARGPVLGTVTDAPIAIDGPDMSAPGVRRGSSSGITRHRAREPVRDSIFPKLSKTLEVMVASTVVRTELEHKMFGKSSKKHSKGKGSSESDASFSKMAQCMKLLEELTPRLPAEQYNKSSMYFLEDNMQDLFLCIPLERRLDWIWWLPFCRK